MKTILFALLFTNIAMASGKRIETRLECRSPIEYTIFNISTEWAAEGHLIHNYSDARIICSADIDRVIKQKGTRTCFGTWTWDFDRAEGKVIDTMAQVEITNDGSKITAITTTSKSYGSQEISMDCKVTQNEIPDQEQK